MEVQSKCSLTAAWIDLSLALVGRKFSPYSVMILECNFADLWSCQAAVRAGFRGGNRSSFGRNAMRLLARLVSGIFKNILEMIVKCILQRLGARARDSDICQC